MYLCDGQFRPPSVQTPSGWTHIVLNYIGPENGEGCQLFLDGVLTGNDVTKTVDTFSTGHGRVVVGRVYTDTDQQYTGAEVDELLFFNQALSEQQVWDIKNMI